MILICKFLKETFSCKISLLLWGVCAFTSCHYSKGADSDQISSINIIDRNGISETISEKQRVNSFQKVDFLAPQPYQKVLRVCRAKENGEVKSYITSYHPNGQVKQYLEIINNRASGAYKEWHGNGELKVEGFIVGGIADIHTAAQESWLFEGSCRASDEDGHLIAEILYHKGSLEGESIYYHPNGAVWKIVPYEKNAIHGEEKLFLSCGTLFQNTEYQHGKKEGSLKRYWDRDHLSCDEIYSQDLLREGRYFSKEGTLVSQVAQGTGTKVVFGKQGIQEKREYRNGRQEGLVELFDEDQGTLLSKHMVKNGSKQGEEIVYFASKPRLSMTWQNGVLQGTVKTWYENGNLETQKEMSQNKKSGTSLAWYKNGELMLVEEYENDKLLKGEYFRLTDKMLSQKMPISKVENGKGIATIFDGEGFFSKKINYREGNPLD